MSQAEPKQAGASGDLPTDLLVEYGLENIRTVGIVMMIFGVIALAAPAIAGTAVSLVIGIAIFAAGVAKIYRVARTKQWKMQWESVLMGVLAAVIGALFIARPLLGLSVLTLYIVIYFAMSGVTQIAWWWRVRRARGALGLILSGLVTLVLAILIGMEWPLSGLWAVGTLIGVHLLFGGASLFALGSPAAKE